MRSMSRGEAAAARTREGDEETATGATDHEEAVMMGIVKDNETAMGAETREAAATTMIVADHGAGQEALGQRGVLLEKIYKCGRN